MGIATLRQVDNHGNEVGPHAWTVWMEVDGDVLRDRDTGGPGDVRPVRRVRDARVLVRPHDVSISGVDEARGVADGGARSSAGGPDGLADAWLALP